MLKHLMCLKRSILVMLLISVCFIFVGNAPIALATTISVTDASVSDWTGVTRFNDGLLDANGSGDTDLVKFWVTGDSTNIYCRWDTILATNRSNISSAGYSIALTSIVPPSGTQPTPELRAFVGFSSNGSVNKVALMKAGNLEQTYSLTNAQSVGSGAGATVSVEAKFSYADINAFLGSNKFGPNGTAISFPLWARSHTAPQSVNFSTNIFSDRVPDTGYLSFNSTTGTSMPVGTGPFASVFATVLNPNTTPGGTVRYAVTITNIGDTTTAPRLLFNQIQWALPNTSFTYINGSTTGITSTNPTQSSLITHTNLTTTNLIWSVTGSLAPGQSTTLYFNATAQNTPGTNLLSEVHILAQTPAITYDTGDVAPVNLNAIYVTPATPINLSATNTTQTTTTLSWSSSANAATYSVYDNGILVQSGITGTSLQLSGLSPESTHNYTVKAISTYNIESGLSTVLNVVTLAPYIVTYDSQGGSIVAGTTKLHNEKITQPTQPTKTGYSFGGWYKEAACTNAWNFANDAVTSNVTIYAKWTINYYTVIFETNGGTTIPSRSVTYGSLLDRPADPTKEGYTFGGWFHDAQLTHVYDYDNFDNDDAIIADRTIYVKWNLNTYTVSFNAQNGIPFPGVEVEAGGKITEPTTIPIKPGYTFIGWYKDDINVLWNFASDTVNSTFTMHAKWSAISYTITTNVTGNGTVSPLNPTVIHGQTVTFTITPDFGYEIDTITFNGSPVIATNDEYTTPAITGNSTLNVTFSLRTPTPPTITNSLPEKKYNILLSVNNKHTNMLEDKLFEKSALSYATISNPDNYTLIGYGMYLKDSQGKWVDLPFEGNPNSGQFGIHIFGEGVDLNFGFVIGETYTKQSYLKYYDLDGTTRKITYGLEKSFVFQ